MAISLAKIHSDFTFACAGLHEDGERSWQLHRHIEWDREVVAGRGEVVGGTGRSGGLRDGT